jgi:hypothetical protein
MKKMKFIKSCLIIVLLAVMSSCGKEEIVLTGKLKVTNVSSSLTYYVFICPAENTSIQLTGDLPITNKETITRELNAGNYVLKGYKYDNTNIFQGFQIKAGETTEINL